MKLSCALSILSFAFTLSMTPSVGAALAKPVPKAKLTAAQKALATSCTAAMSRDSQSNPAIGTLICDCAAVEARSQGATEAAIAREAAAMREDPKLKIADRHVLDAFRACAIDVMHEQSHDQD